MTQTFDPYAPIEKAPLYARDAMRSRGTSVRLADADAPTGWREVGVVSPSYLLVPNAEVRDMAQDVADASGLHWAEDRTFFDGKRFVYGLVADPETVYAEVAPGDVLGVGLMFENSYDGSRKLGASLYVQRLVCANGMLAPEHLARVRFTHSRGSSGWRSELARTMAMLGAAPDRLRSVARLCARLARHRIGTPELAAIRTGPLSPLPVTLWGKVVDRYLGDEDPTAWGLLNAATAEVWHSDRPTVSDFGHNQTATAGLLRYAEGLAEPPTTAPAHLALLTHGHDEHAA